MSQKPSNVNRPRSSSIKPKRRHSNLPEEFSNPNTSFKPRIISAIRIEERLLNQQINYKKKLETLKKNLEEEEMREIRNKPKISEKSRVLAEKAEKRMLQQYIETKDSEPMQIPEKIYSQVQPDFANRSVQSTKAPVKAPTVFTSVMQEGSRNMKKKRTKSLLNLSVLERNEAWLEEKNEKIGKQRRAKQEEDLAECTFSPKTQNKSRHNKSMREMESSNISYISSPYSIENGYEYCEQNSRMAVNKQFAYRPIAPFQVKVSFKCGIDLNSFLKRAK